MMVVDHSPVGGSLGFAGGTGVGAPTMHICAWLPGRYPLLGGKVTGVTPSANVAWNGVVVGNSGSGVLITFAPAGCEEGDVPPFALVGLPSTVHVEPWMPVTLMRSVPITMSKGNDVGVGKTAFCGDVFTLIVNVFWFALVLTTP